jgi:hypothetical protein
MNLSLNAPKQIIFIIAVVIAVIALIQVLTGILAFIPISAFWTMTIAFVVLAGGVLIKGA